MAMSPLLVVVPVLLAQTPLPSDMFVPFVPPSAYFGAAPGDAGQVQTFDPTGRARLLAGQMPRAWRGSYQPFDSASAVPVDLVLDTVTPLGQMVDLRGRITVAGVTTPVQGNLNAKSDQLDLLLLGESFGGGLEAGGYFQGVEGLQLSGWDAPRLTSMGGRLQLSPGPSREPRQPDSTPPVRGLW